MPKRTSHPHLLPSQARPGVTVTAREVASAAGAAWRAIDPQMKGEYEARSAAEKASRHLWAFAYLCALPVSCRSQPATLRLILAAFSV